MAYFRRVDAFPNLLGTFFIGARFPNFEDLTETKIIDDCMWLLQRINEPNPVPRAIRAYRSEWITKRNFLGSYSLFTTNSAHHGVSPTTLAETVYAANGRPRIFFAGEHTSALFSGYANGAVESGFRAGTEASEHISGSGSNSMNLILMISMLFPAFLKI